MSLKIKIKVSFLFFIILSFTACNGVPATKNWANDWIDEDISRLKKLEKNTNSSAYVKKWRNQNIIKNYTLENENLIYITPVRENCLVEWEVDKDTNKIINYKLLGDRCY